MQLFEISYSFIVQVCNNVVVRADLQSATQRINLVPGNLTDLSTHSRDSLAPGSTIDQVESSILRLG